MKTSKCWKNVLFIVSCITLHRVYIRSGATRHDKPIRNQPLFCSTTFSVDKIWNYIVFYFLSSWPSNRGASNMSWQTDNKNRLCVFKLGAFYVNLCTVTPFLTVLLDFIFMSPLDVQGQRHSHEDKRQTHGSAVNTLRHVLYP